MVGAGPGFMYVMMDFLVCSSKYQIGNVCNVISQECFSYLSTEEGQC